jgi:hypothetical protein
MVIFQNLLLQEKEEMKSIRENYLNTNNNS